MQFHLLGACKVTQINFIVSLKEINIMKLLSARFGLIFAIIFRPQLNRVDPNGTEVSTNTSFMIIIFSGFCDQERRWVDLVVDEDSLLLSPNVHQWLLKRYILIQITDKFFLCHRSWI